MGEFPQKKEFCLSYVTLKQISGPLWPNLICQATFFNCLEKTMPFRYQYHSPKPSTNSFHCTEFCALRSIKVFKKLKESGKIPVLGRPTHIRIYTYMHICSPTQFFYGLKWPKYPSLENRLTYITKTVLEWQKPKVSYICKKCLKTF